MSRGIDQGYVCPRDKPGYITHGLDQVYIYPGVTQNIVHMQLYQETANIGIALV